MGPKIIINNIPYQNNGLREQLNVNASSVQGFTKYEKLNYSGIIF